MGRKRTFGWATSFILTRCWAAFARAAVADVTKGTGRAALRCARMTTRRIVAVCLVTHDELGRLGTNFERARPIDEVPCFAGLLEAIDEAERELWRERDYMAKSPIE